eukprot:5308336-Pyramimonas_sp.AAC.1
MNGGGDCRRAGLQLSRSSRKEYSPSPQMIGRRCGNIPPPLARLEIRAGNGSSHNGTKSTLIVLRHHPVTISISDLVCDGERAARFFGSNFGHLHVPAAPARGERQNTIGHERRLVLHLYTAQLQSLQKYSYSHYRSTVTVTSEVQWRVQQYMKQVG